MSWILNFRLKYIYLHFLKQPGRHRQCIWYWSQLLSMHRLVYEKSWPCNVLGRRYYYISTIKFRAEKILKCKFKPAKLVSLSIMRILQPKLVILAERVFFALQFQKFVDNTNLFWYFCDLLFIPCAMKEAHSRWWFNLKVVLSSGRKFRLNSIILVILLLEVSPSSRH